MEKLSCHPRVFALLAALVLGAALGMADHAAAAPAAGSVIENRARMSYVDEVTGFAARLESNAVRVEVQAVAALTLSADQTARRVPGSSFSFAHRLSNTGNAAATVHFTLEPADARLIRDSNGNGVADPGEAEIDPDDEVLLAAGAALQLLVIGTVPGGAAAGSSLAIRLSAQAEAQGSAARVSNTDTVTVARGPVLQVWKSAVGTARPGDELVFRISATNTGAASASGRPLWVDGQPLSRVLLADLVPANTVAVSASGAQGQALYHLRGQAQNRYVSQLPADRESIDEVAWAVDSLAPNQSLSFDLRLYVRPNASGAVENSASARFANGADSVDGASDSGPEESRSNTVTLPMPVRPPIVSFFRDADFSAVAASASRGTTLYVEVDAAACNRDPRRAEQVSLTLGSALTGDEETYLVEETGANTGIFRLLRGVPTTEGAALAGDGRLAVQQDDRITASLAGCGAASTEATVLIDPYGVVFDSKTNALVAGAVVSLIDVSGEGNGGQPGGPAQVFAVDGSTPAPATVVSDGDGRYAFPLVAPSDYRLEVVPPQGYEFPSVLPPAMMPAGRVIDSEASYGRDFTVSAFTGAVRADLPLDAPPNQGLRVRKKAGRDQVEIGDFLDYTVEVKNTTASTLGGVQLMDTLPPGFAYVAGSTRRDGQRVADPAAGAPLVFDIGSVAANTAATLVYRVRITALARQGHATNRAQAASAAPLAASSNVAAATVRVAGGVFSSRGYLLGRVFLDCDGDGFPGPGEPGIAGARLILETGDSAVADGKGQYHFDDLLPVTHVVKLDPASLPQALAALASSQFVDMKNGELRRADFPLRSAAACVVPASAAESAVAPLPAPARGMRPAPLAPLQSLLPDLAAELAFLSPADGAVLPAAQATLRLKGPAGAALQLAVNGAEVPAERIGTRVVDAGRGVQALEYVGVPLAVGANRLVLTARDAFGNVRATAAISVTAPGPLARIELAPAGTPVADGRTPTQIRVRLFDAAGVPVAARTALTLETRQGRWQVKDLDPLTPGVQTFVSGGEALLGLLAPELPGEGLLRASAGTVTGEARLAFAPALRPLVAAGIVEGVFDLSRLGLGGRQGGLQAATASDGFEQELRRLGGEQQGARAALFLKGKVRGDTLLTLAYDSEKPAREQLFRDIQPDRYYPVYGDESSRSFEARSADKLYVRLDRGASWALYGDFTTAAPAGGSAGMGGIARGGPALARYSRSLTGIKAHGESGALKAEGFASQGRNRQVVEEFAGTGTSGPFRLRAADIVGGSEKVELLVRDRYQPGVILSATPLTGFVDYELDGGRLLMRRPVPSLDANLNPVFLRVTYESDQGGEDFWVLGGDVEARVSEQLTVGASLAEDQNPQDPYQLGGMRARWQAAAGTVLTAELAQSSRLSVGEGQAGRVELVHRDGPLTAQASVGRADGNFDNPAAPLQRGREEASVKTAYVIDPQTRLTAEAVRSINAQSGGRREGLRVSLEQQLAPGLQLETGLRRVHATASASPLGGVGVVDSGGSIATDSATGSLPSTAADFTSARVRLSATPAQWSATTVYGEVEQALGGAGHLAAAGGEYRFAQRGRLYARHEFVNTLAGFSGLGEGLHQRATVVGIDGDYMEGGHLFSEYRGRDAFDGRAAEAAIGLRNLWPVAPGLRLSTGFERVTTLGGGNQTSNNEALALTGGVEWTVRPDLKGTARLEWRDAPASRNWLATAGAAWKLDEAWSLLGKGSLDLAQPKNGSADAVRERLQAGVAYRDPRGHWLGLARYAWIKDQGPVSDRDAHLVSLHANLQPERRTEWVLRYAAKLNREGSDGIASQGVAQLLSARWLRQLDKNWDVGLGVGLKLDGGLAHSETGLSAELGYRLTENLWLAAGYNWLDVRDADLAGDLPGHRGAFLRLRFKFDEKLLAGLLPK